MSSGLTVHAPDGVPEVVAGADLAALLLAVTAVADGDVVVVTSKVVSKAEGRVRRGDREQAIDEETVRLVARRGATRIVRTRLGLTVAAAGVDASNVEPGLLVLLPEDPDASARGVRASIAQRTGRNVGVLVTDTAGRTWREGQTDLAIGAAGVVVAVDLAGRIDGYGNPLSVTLPAVADEIAGAADLVRGKLAGRPFAVVRGLDHLVLPAGEHGPGAASLVRRDGGDLFGYGAREAVVRALAGDPADRRAFGDAVPLDELAGVLAEVGVGRSAIVPDEHGPGAEVELSASDALLRLRTVCFAHGWEVVSPAPPDDDPVVRARVQPLVP